MEPHFAPDDVYPVMDQQQELLHATDYHSHTSMPTVNIADQIERGGARIEETLGRMNCSYESLFFLASWGVISASLLGAAMAIFRFELSSLINSIFLSIFGCTMMILDIPGRPRWAGKYRRSIRKYARFLTRLTGKSLWFLYLGCMIIVCIWPRRSQTSSSSATALLIAIFLSCFVNCVALLGLFIALRKSLRLERVRKALVHSYQGNWPEVYRKYAVNDPSHGMQYEEFSRLASDYSQGKLLFDWTDLHIIFEALDEHQKSAVNEVEFGQWMTGGYKEDGTGWALTSKLSMTYL